MEELGQRAADGRDRLISPSLIFFIDPLFSKYCSSKLLHVEQHCI